jgi:hypothetical protein
VTIRFGFILRGSLRVKRTAVRGSGKNAVCPSSVSRLQLLA